MQWCVSHFGGSWRHTHVWCEPAHLTWIMNRCTVRVFTVVLVNSLFWRLRGRWCWAEPWWGWCSVGLGTKKLVELNLLPWWCGPGRMGRLWKRRPGIPGEVAALGQASKSNHLPFKILSHLVSGHHILRMVFHCMFPYPSWWKEKCCTAIGSLRRCNLWRRQQAVVMCAPWFHLLNWDQPMAERSKAARCAREWGLCLAWDWWKESLTGEQSVQCWQAVPQMWRDYYGLLLQF